MVNNAGTLAFLDGYAYASENARKCGAVEAENRKSTPAFATYYLQGKVVTFKIWW